MAFGELTYSQRAWIQPNESPNNSLALTAIVKSVTWCPRDPVRQASAKFAFCKAQGKQEQRATQPGASGLSPT